MKLSLLFPNLYVLAGPRLDIEMKQNVDENLKIVFDKFKKNIFGLTFGVGTEINIILLDLLAEIRYNYDITPAYETDLLVIKNRSFEFRTGIKF